MSNPKTLEITELPYEHVLYIGVYTISHWPDPQKQAVSVQKVYQEFIAVYSWGPDLDNKFKIHMYIEMFKHVRMHSLYLE